MSKSLKDKRTERLAEIREVMDNRQEFRALTSAEHYATYDFLLNELDKQHDEFYNEVRILDQKIEGNKREMNHQPATDMKPLKGRRLAIYNYLISYIAKNSYSPSQREISEAVGLLSGSTVNGHLERLERDGYIDRNGSKPRAIRITGARS